MSILGCCLAFGWALTVAVVPFSHPHGINEGQVSGCIAAEREAGPLVGPYSSRTLPESTLLQLTWFPNLSQAKGGWLWTCPFLLGTVSAMASLTSWHLSHARHVGTSLILICGWRCAAADPAPWAAGEGGLEAGLLHLQHQHLATSWERSAYVDRALPVGLRSALRNFTAVQIWLLGYCIGQVFRTKSHYLNDFHFSAPPPPPGYWRSCQAPVSCSVSYRGGALGYPPQTHFFTQTF